MMGELEVHRFWNEHCDDRVQIKEKEMERQRKYRGL